MKGFRNLIKRIESRDISPLFTATYPLEDILLHSVLEKKTFGKIVLKVG
jgi:NADPH:quinone reductase-like Zn-dependent oxidoreductase